MKRLKKPAAKDEVRLLPPMRENAQVLETLVQRADEVGITKTEAMRQILQQYADKPWPLKRPDGYYLELDARFPPVRVAPEVEAVILKQAEKIDISPNEAMRQILRRWLGIKP